MFGFLKCWLFGHPEYRKNHTKRYVKEQCVRCGHYRKWEATYFGRASKFLDNTSRGPIYEPVESITDSKGKELKPGDRARYYDHSRQAFPGVHIPSSGYSGTVEFLFIDSLRDKWLKVKHDRKLIPERDLIAFDRRERQAAKVSTD